LKTAIENGLEKVIFASRWVQAPMYLGLIVASLAYAYKFLLELVHLISDLSSLTEESVLMILLTLVDIVMVANLLTMVIVGGYATFVSRLDFLNDHKDRPDWLDKIDAGTLKVKLAGALVGISAIHLLKTFINIKHHEERMVFWQVIIHVVFLGSSVVLAVTENLMHKKHDSH
jgi:uncharacterized protein (TIGR00645 family)